MKSKGKYLIVNVGPEDRESIARIMNRHGHNTRPGAVRLALRAVVNYKPNKVSQGIVINVRKEALKGTPPSSKFFETTDRIPISFSAQDAMLLPKIIKKFEISSFSQAIRLAVRLFDVMETVK